MQRQNSLALFVFENEQKSLFVSFNSCVCDAAISAGHIVIAELDARFLRISIVEVIGWRGLAGWSYSRLDMLGL